MLRASPEHHEGEVKDIAFRFANYLIEKRLIEAQEPALDKVKLLEYYDTFQSKMPRPTCVRREDIVQVLHSNSLLVKRGQADDKIEFKRMIFHNTVDCNPSHQFVKIRAIMYISEHKFFKMDHSRASAITGLECRMCHETFANNLELNGHEDSDVHRFREMFRTARRDFATEIVGVAISKITRTLEKDERDESTIRISSTCSSNDGFFVVKKVIPLIDLEGIHIESSMEKTVTGAEKTFQLKVIARFSQYCSYEYPIVFVIKDTARSKEHNVLSVVTYQVLKKDIHNLYTGDPYKPLKKKSVRFVDAPVERGICLWSTNIFYKVSLDTYHIPQFLITYLRTGFKPNVSTARDLSLWRTMSSLLNNSNNDVPMDYIERFELLLYLEEYQQHRSVLSYNQKDVTLTANKSQNLWDLSVPGLSENRPSILKGDSVFVLFDNKNIKFEGIVHDVRENVVSLAFGGKFHYVRNQKVDVEFQLNRTAFKMAHRALELYRNDESLLRFINNFTVRSDIIHNTHQRRYYNREIEGNNFQRVAVDHIIRKTANPAPYIVYGPPGTGKTSTIVEAITQLHFNTQKSFKICVCAPSNAAANLLACRLVKYVPQTEILRLFGLSYNGDIPTELQRCCNFNKEKNDVFFPSIENIKAKKIVVLTPITAGRLYSVLGEGFFDYLFFDEAGQAEEPFFLVPLTGLLKQYANGMPGGVVLTGDPKQLGPIIHSRLASQLGLDISLMERLMRTCDLYKKRDGVYNVNFITKLRNNYRSHSSFLEIPNQLFYDGELEGHADENATQWLCSWDGLPVKNLPLIFHGVKGKDERESNSPSYFNLFEITCVGDYLTNLVGRKIRGREIEQDNIVVLTPYRKQVQKFRQYFRQKKWENIKVSSIEEFQGQERYIVIISCVRSRKEFLADDYKFGLGFLRNPKRFNVALTRAKSLMIIVGNPDVLQCDPCWAKLMNHCRILGCYKGAVPDCNIEDTKPVANKHTSALELTSLIFSADNIPDCEKPSLPKHE